MNGGGVLWGIGWVGLVVPIKWPNQEDEDLNRCVIRIKVFHQDEEPEINFPIDDQQGRRSKNRSFPWRLALAGRHTGGEKIHERK